MEHVCGASASAWQSDGVPTRCRLGDRSAATTLDVSTDLFEDDLGAVAPAFDEKCAEDVPESGLKAVE